MGRTPSVPGPEGSDQLGSGVVHPLLRHGDLVRGGDHADEDRAPLSQGPLDDFLAASMGPSVIATFEETVPKATPIGASESFALFLIEGLIAQPPLLPGDVHARPRMRAEPARKRGPSTSACSGARPRRRASTRRGPPRHGATHPHGDLCRPRLGHGVTADDFIRPDPRASSSATTSGVRVGSSSSGSATASPGRRAPLQAADHLKRSPEGGLPGIELAEGGFDPPPSRSGRPTSWGTVGCGLLRPDRPLTLGTSRRGTSRRRRREERDDLSAEPCLRANVRLHRRTTAREGARSTEAPTRGSTVTPAEE